jgi:hypothetical protein
MAHSQSSVSGLFKWRQFEPEVILLAVGWYLRFSLSYRDVEELLAERGLLVDHVTVWRWVQRYAPEMERRLRRRLKPTTDSWREQGSRSAAKSRRNPNFATDPIKTAIPHSMRRKALTPRWALWPNKPTMIATATGNTKSNQR